MKKKNFDQIDLEISANIKAYRKMFGLKQGTLAEMVGVSVQQIHKYEQGLDKVSIAMLAKIAQAFKCRITDLIPVVKQENTNVIMVAERSKEIKQAKYHTEADNAKKILRIFFSLNSEQQQVAVKQMEDFFDKINEEQKSKHKKQQSKSCK